MSCRQTRKCSAKDGQCRNHRPRGVGFQKLKDVAEACYDAQDAGTTRAVAQVSGGYCMLKLVSLMCLEACISVLLDRDCTLLGCRVYIAQPVSPSSAFSVRCTRALAFWLA